MSEPSETLPHTALPDTAMMSGSDDGEPGDRRPAPTGEGDADRDAAVMDALSHAGPAVVQPVEETSDAASAAEDDSVLPLDVSDAPADPLDPVFREPSR